ncbi:hypothetical protein HGRIS_008608 [Hohenbuehelia grisea]|uniref:Uncharacterized protein n=1 Tax=Hohenbuehelia grisea TaxID=104357 RepID=A0ABR3J8R2_9AGAR
MAPFVAASSFAARQTSPQKCNPSPDPTAPINMANSQFLLFSGDGSAGSTIEKPKSSSDRRGRFRLQQVASSPPQYTIMWVE